MANKKSPKFVTEITLKRETARLDKDINQALTLLKAISAEVKSTAKATSKISGFEKKFSEISGGISALQKQIAEAPKHVAKKPRKLTEMNLFVREQVKSGKSFSEAIQAWKAYRASKAAPSGLPGPNEKSTP